MMSQFHFVGSLLGVMILITPLLSQDEYQEWLKKQKQGLLAYVEEQDRVFAEFLKAEWEQLNAFKAIIPDETPKPVKIPVYKPPEEVRKPKLPPEIKPIKTLPAPKPEPLPPIKPEERPKPPVEQPVKTLVIDFLGQSINVDLYEEMTIKIDGKIDEAYASDYWQAMAQTQYAPTLKQAEYYKAQLGLNDWGYGFLLRRIGDQIYNGDHDRVNLFTWFMLLKSGYDAKVGYNNERILLLIPSQQLIYGVPFYRFDGSEKKYYSLVFGMPSEQGGTALKVYEGDYPDARTLMDFSVKRVPALENNLSKRVRRFNYNGKQYEVSTMVNQGVVDLFRYYPQSSLTVFFDAAISPSVNQALLGSLDDLVDGKSETEAVNILLRFVQAAFAYQTDQEQFGREKYLIPDETLYYSYCDCEDRSILFAHLVRKLIGLSVVGLNYPGHVATAVNFSNELPGTYVTYHNEKYLICDPTYINSEIGMVMPRYKDIKPELIELH